MDLTDISQNKVLAELTETFLNNYGSKGYQCALETYTKMQQFYICRNRQSVHKILWDEIYYLDILGHTITIHTRDQTYQKYGSLSKELKLLPKNLFIRCSQSCVVAVPKIASVTRNQLFLSNGTILHISRNYEAHVLNVFLGQSGRH